MFKKNKSKVLVDCASEEDDMSWYQHHSYKDKDIEGEEEEEEEAVTVVSKEAKVKKSMSKKERKDRKMFSSKDDEHMLLTGENMADRRGSHKKIKDDEKEKEKKPEKGQCFWDSVTTTMRQISPAKKPEKIEGWEPPPPHTERPGQTDKPSDDRHRGGDGVVPCLQAVDPDSDSWAGRGLEEDSSRYANLSDPRDRVGAARWTDRAKVKLAGIGRMGRGMVSESMWEGLK